MLLHRDGFGARSAPKLATTIPVLVACQGIDKTQSLGSSHELAIAEPTKLTALASLKTPWASQLADNTCVLAPADSLSVLTAQISGGR